MWITHLSGYGQYPHHYESRDRQSVVDGVSEQWPVGQMDNLKPRNTHEITLKYLTEPPSNTLWLCALLSRWEPLHCIFEDVIYWSIHICWIYSFILPNLYTLHVWMHPAWTTCENSCKDSDLTHCWNILVWWCFHHCYSISVVTFDVKLMLC